MKDVQVSPLSVDAYKDCNLGVGLGEYLLRRVEGFKLEQRVATKFCVKLKKTAPEML
jgi:hypothetical protein